ncbi:ABC transporter permease [Paenibacillus etheri]|uniref:ABC transporter permease n=2 Tax=Paenibacillus etheri TaxID=1306852 RepID=A0A0W1AY79_9BACL|nr:ABC transporter permease [Paenibacillus etheri]
MAGISIGCAAIIVALSIGDSAQSYTEREINRNFKMDEITVTPNGGIPSQGGREGSGASATDAKLDPGRLTAQKLKIVQGLQHVTAAAPFQELGYIQMTTIDNKITDLQLIGTDLRLLTKYDHRFKQGGPSDLVGMAVLNDGATVGLIDTETRQRLFEQLNTDPYNNKLMEQYNSLSMLPSDMYKQQVQLQSYDPASQNGQSLVSSPLQIVGILDSGGNPDMAMYDKKIYVSLETGERLVEQLKLTNGTAGQKDVYNSAIVKVDSTDNIVQVEKLIQKLTLTTSTNLYQKEAIADQFSMIKKAALGIGVFILIIASISIIVAMTMSTHARRRQIGIMKVLGANMGQIRNMFITEAALLGMLGGLLGIVFSYLIVFGINKLIGTAGMGMGEPLVITIPLMTLPIGIAFAVMTGVLSGIYPAISASRTNALTAIKRD